MSANQLWLLAEAAADNTDGNVVSVEVEVVVVMLESVSGNVGCESPKVVCAENRVNRPEHERRLQVGAGEIGVWALLLPQQVVVVMVVVGGRWRAVQ